MIAELDIRLLRLEFLIWLVVQGKESTADHVLGTP